MYSLRISYMHRKYFKHVLPNSPYQILSVWSSSYTSQLHVPLKKSECNMAFHTPRCGPSTGASTPLRKLTLPCFTILNANCFSARSGASWGSPQLLLECWLAWSGSGKCSCSEVKRQWSVLFRRHCSPWPPGSPFPHCSLSPVDRECGVDSHLGHYTMCRTESTSLVFLLSFYLTEHIPRHLLGGRL